MWIETADCCRRSPDFAIEEGLVDDSKSEIFTDEITLWLRDDLKDSIDQKDEANPQRHIGGEEKGVDKPSTRA